MRSSLSFSLSLSLNKTDEPDRRTRMRSVQPAPNPRIFYVLDILAASSLPTLRIDSLYVAALGFPSMIVQLTEILPIMSSICAILFLINHGMSLGC
jgi:hypothetical protein